MSIEKTNKISRYFCSIHTVVVARGGKGCMYSIKYEFAPVLPTRTYKSRGVCLGTPGNRPRDPPMHRYQTFSHWYWAFYGRGVIFQIKLRKN